MAVPVLGRSRVLLNHSPLSSITAARRTRQFRCPCSWTRAMSGDAGDGGEVGAGAANSKRVMKRKRDAQCPDVEDLAKKWSEGDIGNARRQLLAWYDRGHRILPWRRNAHSQRDDAGGGAPADLDDSTFAYRVWVSEVMLQQTRVQAVISYFQKWVQRWPDVRALAAATLEEVNEVWAGLGYYRRARFLLEGAQYVVSELQGTMPSTAEGLRKVPGIGPYTAAAVASIAFGRAEAAVDGNVIRVVSRLWAVPGDVKKGAVAKRIQSLASEFLDRDRPGDFNQAMMELGATVCVPSGQPQCGVCPLSGVCVARKEEAAFRESGGDVSAPDAPLATRFPQKVEKKGPRDETVDVHVVELCPRPEEGSPGTGGTVDGQGGAPPKYLLVQRPAKGILAGLWEFPSVVREGADEGASDDEGGSGGDAAEEAYGVTGVATGADGGVKKRAEGADGVVDGIDKGKRGSSAKSADARAVAAEARPEGSDGLRRVLAEVFGDADVISSEALRDLGEAGTLTHVFSHVRHTMHVRRWRWERAGEPVALEGARGVRWLTEAELESAALTSGVQKVRKLVFKAGGESGGAKGGAKGGRKSKGRSEGEGSRQGRQRALTEFL